MHAESQKGTKNFQVFAFDGKNKKTAGISFRSPGQRALRASFVDEADHLVERIPVHIAASVAEFSFTGSRSVVSYKV